MEVDWLLLGYRAVASWNMQLGSRLRTPWRRSVTRTLWVDSYTSAKIERPSLASPILVPRAEASKAAWVAAEASAVALEALLEALPAVAAGRFTLPTFVPRIPNFQSSTHLLTWIPSSLTTSVGKT
jgi:hypothetical protein